MTSDGSPSLARDLSRIVILGMAYDLSRYAARRALGAPSSTRNSRAHAGDESEEYEATRDDVGRRPPDGDENEEGQRGSSAVVVGKIIAPSNFLLAEITERWRIHLKGLRRHFPDTSRDRGRVALGCYLLLTPPLVAYGAWDLLCRNGNVRRPSRSSSSFAGAYFSSAAASFALLLWIVPEVLRRGKEDDDVEKGDEPVHRDDREKRADNLREPPEEAAERLPPIMPPIPSTISRPPSGPGGDEIERRPRSDSLRSATSECSVGTQTRTANAPAAEKNQKKYLEILVHNVSHTDLILGLSGDRSSPDSAIAGGAPASTPFPAEFEDTPRKRNASPRHDDDAAAGSEEKYIMCRPRFSAFDLFSRRVLNELRGRLIEGVVPPPPEESNDRSDRSASNGRRPLHRKVISYPRYERSSKTARYTLVTPRPSERFLLPVGFDLGRDEGVNDAAVDPREMPNLRLRGRDVSRVDPSLLGETTTTTPRRRTNANDSSPPNDGRSGVARTPLPAGRGPAREASLRIDAVFFPLLATLLPRWLGKIADEYGEGGAEAKKVAAPLPSPNVKKVVVLVSGVGTPRNWTHSIGGNSTRACAELMELFVRVLHPDVAVVRIHSETNIFRYDENITFATQELMPCIDSYRDAHARCEPYPDEKAGDEGDATSERNPFNPDWRQSVSVTYSFADGSAARSHAIQAALRPYRPTYFHFWQLKTFWHESKITDEDIEVHSFEEMETVPAMAVDQTSESVTMVVNEMKAFRRDFIETQKDGGRSDLKSFWLRKTRKPVLAVLLVRKPGGERALYRGANMEVSMPTGSLCAERNVIGTALADDPGLKREDLLMVAVLSVRLPERSPPPPPPGPPVCRPAMPSSRADFALEVGDRLRQHQAIHGGGMRRTASASSFASIAEDGPVPESSSEPPAEHEGWETGSFQHVPLSPLGSPVAAPTASPPPGATSIPELNLTRLCERSPSSGASGRSTPKRRISLYQKKSHGKIGGGMKRRKESLLVQSLEDMNPLKPCGACNEWLKKIAESNPHFKVLTFTDAECNGVYVSPCQE